MRVTCITINIWISKKDFVTVHAYTPNNIAFFTSINHFSFLELRKWSKYNEWNVNYGLLNDKDFVVRVTPKRFIISKLPFNMWRQISIKISWNR